MKFPLKEFIQYLEATSPDSWCVDVVRTKDGKNCLFGHLFQFGAGESNNEKEANRLWDLFECEVASTYMIYPVNDKENDKYQQETAKERCIQYLKDIESGKEFSSAQLWEMMA